MVSKFWGVIRHWANLPLGWACFLFVLLTAFAGYLWVGEVSYNHPGPAIIVMGLAVTSFLVGGGIHRLWLRARAAQPAHPPPRLIGLELLVQQLDKFKAFMVATKPNLGQEILTTQVLLAQAVAQADANTATPEIHFTRAFDSVKPQGGTFQIRLGANPSRAPLVLKFDSRTHIEQEIHCYNQYVRQFLNLTPGEPKAYLIPQAEIQDEEWGAITYNLLGAGTSNLWSFNDFYRDCQTVEAITPILEDIFAHLKAWREQKAPGSQTGLYREYKRLSVKLEKIKMGWQAVELQAEAQRLLPELPDPLAWVECVFQSKEFFDQKFSVLNATSRNSIVHGDFHGGNILLSKQAQQKTFWLIDFPHTHVGPTVQDIARLEACLKFTLLPAELLLDDEFFKQLYVMEDKMLGNGQRDNLDFWRSDPTRPPMFGENAGLAALGPKAALEINKLWGTIGFLHHFICAESLIVGDARHYYLALLHSTLPVLYYRDLAPRQKLYAFMSAALLCQRLDQTQAATSA